MKLKLFLLFFLALIHSSLYAQTKENPFYANGKIYVVVAVISIIFTGIIGYLIKIDRQLKRTEKELRDQK